MSQFWKKIRSLKEKIFGGIQTKPNTELNPLSLTQVTNVRVSNKTFVHERKNPYFIQVGFDFGTSYSKCVCRDMIVNKAWVHIPHCSEEQELPFLIPSALILENNKLSHVEDTKIHYPKSGLYHLKSALILAANGDLDDPLLVPYRNAVRLKKTNQLPDFIVDCAVYFLAGALGEIRKKVRVRFPGFGLLPEDYMAINLAIPVEDAEQPQLNKLYNLIISEAWRLSDQLAGHPPIHLTELQSLRKNSRANLNRSVDDACFIYPEVSANVQGFVRSRVSSPGIYLFSDTGGGTVDQSVFIFIRSDNKERLTYLAGRVLPLGSSQIERRIAAKHTVIDRLTLENWRDRKERGENCSELREAQVWIFDRLAPKTEGTIFKTKKKLIVKDQLNYIRVIFGGGGHCEYPYKKAVLRPFSGQLFREALCPDIVGLPIPKDIELNSNETHWMRRLNVAYGLSFEKSELAPFTYPKDVSNPKPEEIWQPHKVLFHAPTKDVC